MLPEEEKVKIQGERNELIDRFSRLIVEWMCLEPQFVLAKEKNKERSELVKQLDLNYWKLDPYIRLTTYYHRVGVINRHNFMA